MKYEKALETITEPLQLDTDDTLADVVTNRDTGQSWVGPNLRDHRIIRSAQTKFRMHWKEGYNPIWEPCVTVSDEAISRNFLRYRQVSLRMMEAPTEESASKDALRNDITHPKRTRLHCFTPSYVAYSTMCRSSSSNSSRVTTRNWKRCTEDKRVLRSAVGTNQVTTCKKPARLTTGFNTIIHVHIIIVYLHINKLYKRRAEGSSTPRQQDITTSARASIQYNKKSEGASQKRRGRL